VRQQKFSDRRPPTDPAAVFKFKQSLGAIRRFRNLSQAQLASQLARKGYRVSREMVAHWENPHNLRIPTPKIIARIAAILDVTKDQIWNGIQAHAGDEKCS
jgi:transcriptional regulator with XRE-family HTH domain